MLVLDAHLEAVLPIDPGEVVGDLEGRADFVRGQEVVAAQVGQVVDVEIGQSAILGDLRNIGDSDTAPECPSGCRPVQSAWYAGERSRREPG